MAAKTITNTVPFSDAQGNALVNGTLTLDLSAPAEITTGGGLIDQERVVIALNSSGNIPASTLLYANDQLTPTTTFYVARLFNQNGLRVGAPQQWTISGTSPIDLSKIVPVVLP